MPGVKEMMPNNAAPVCRRVICEMREKSTNIVMHEPPPITLIARGTLGLLRRLS